MRLENNFDNLINRENAALMADLKCSCNSKTFEILHTGIQKSSFFGKESLKKKNGQIVIKAKCDNCNKEYVIYDSTTDGPNPKGTKENDYETITIKENKKFNITIKYNYLEDNFKTDNFEMILIDIKDPSSSKYIRIFEE